ncbi:MAG: 2-C-methyl-D-erythritol 2,4-cyclodiphosphate synthase [Candidatus Obscuribacterales bacterium]|nr:2-C-methyl-D-erythritol 2,4-cyclodiphosphate synthase [Candidatus Obscuribacterales bacterium]
MRVGIGFDIHRLVPGRPFVIGGVSIPFDKGPLGHSDGDALSHAVADAILGAANMGDIGMWFPPGDPDFAGANSLDLLATIAEAVRQKGFAIGNIDSVIMCERPKMSPHYSLMKERLAKALGTSPEVVSVKATTYEGMGEIGSGEAVAAKAIALLTY